MSYSSKLHESKEKAYRHATASKILDLMDKLRLEENEDSPRRWIWELMQNAKDVAHVSNPIRIEVDFRMNGETKVVQFRHNGQPFSLDNITFLIEQVSTKDRNKQNDINSKTTGKFGTGFLTTHLLSEQVEIEGVIKEPDEPYRTFNITLDRRGRSIDEMMSSLDNSVLALENVDEQQAYDEYSLDGFNTAFRYILDDDGVGVAEKGFADLRQSVIFTLVFLPEIRSINVGHENVTYELSDAVLPEGNDIRIYTVVKRTSGGASETKVAVLTKNGTSIAVEIEYENGRIVLKGISPSVPRLFCDFPLVGSEDFPFPVIINSSSFNPNEPRNGIFLTDKSDPRVEENKAIMAQAVELYTVLLKHVSQNNWDKPYLLAKIPKSKEKEWMSQTWVQKHVIDPIRDKLLTTPIVCTDTNEKIPILTEEGEVNAWFPSAKKPEHRYKIWELASAWIPTQLPRKSDIDEWSSIIWPQCGALTVDVLSRSLNNRGNLNQFRAELSEGSNPVDWLNSYFELLSIEDLEDKYLNDIANDKYAVIPNQHGEFKAKSKLMEDGGIEEELKNVLVILEEDPRYCLKHKDIKTGKLKYSVKSQESAIEDINRIITKKENAHIAKACDYLVTLFSDDAEFPPERESLFELCKRVFPDDVTVKRHIEKWSIRIWQEVDRLQTERIVRAVSDTGSIYDLTENLNFNSTSACLEWLNDLVTFFTKHGFGDLLNQEQWPILPNQNGSFHVKDDLFLDGEIDEELKEICADLGNDYRNKLLDVSIYLNLSNARTLSELDISEEIRRLVTPRLAEVPRTNETKQLFKRLYLWFTNNKDKAEVLFDELYTNKHKFYDDDEVAESIYKAEMYADIMNEFGLKTAEDLREILQSHSKQNHTYTRTEVTQEVLVSLGVTSAAELERALADKDLAGQFTHTSTPTVEMFVYVQNLIERAKENVIKYLSRHPEYDCTELEELAPTVIGGIKKNGLMTNVVVRPSDNGEVIVYYSSEKDMLDYANAELWIDNGIEQPLHLTLGRILKKTGINRFMKNTHNTLEV